MASRIVLFVALLMASGPVSAQQPGTLTAERYVDLDLLSKSFDWARIIQQQMDVKSGHLGPGTLGGETPPGGRTTTETQELPPGNGLPGGTRTTTMTVNAQRAGPKLMVKSSLRFREVRGGLITNGAINADAEADACPDASGVVHVKIELAVSGDTAVTNTAGTGGGSYNVRYKITGYGQVGDDAMLQRTTIDADVTQTGRTGSRLSNGSTQGQSETSNFELRARVTVTAEGGADGLTQSDWSGRADGASIREQNEAFAKYSAEFAQRFAKTAFENAQALWRNGYCLEIKVTDPAVKDGTRRTEPKQTLNFMASVRHKFEMADLPLPIDISLSGKERVSPSRIDRAPGQITFVSGEGDKDDGTVRMKSVSRRGIAEATSKFDNNKLIYELALFVGPHFVIDARVCDIDKPFDVRPKGQFSGVKVSFRPTSDSSGSFTEAGRAYGVQWKGSGNYTIAWDNEKLIGRFVATNPNTATAPVGKSVNNDTMTGTVRRFPNIYMNFKCR